MPASGQDVGDPPSLTVPISGAKVSPPSDPTGPTVRRVGAVRVDANVLGDLARSAGPKSVKRVALQLFPDTRVTAVLNGSEPVYERRTGVSGRIEGETMSDVAFIEREGRLTANVRVPGTLYEIRPRPDGTHLVREIDPTSFPDEAEPLEGPKPGIGAHPDDVDVLEGHDPDPDAQENGNGASQNSPQTSGDAKYAPAGDGTLVDILVAYSDDVRAALGSRDAVVDLVALGIYETNRAYYDSNIDQRLRLAGAEEYKYTETGNSSTDLGRLRNDSDGYLDGVHTERDEIEADAVSLWVESMGACGRGYVLNTNSTSFAGSAFNVVRRSCATGYYSFGHELGHNFGLDHDWYVNSDTNPYDYCHGYVNVSDGWRTIMAYNSECADNGTSCERLRYFSNPGVDYGGDPMGSTSSSEPADAARCLDDTKSSTSQFRTGRTIASSADYDQFGRTLARGDFNDDGAEDLAIGVPYFDSGSVNNVGRVLILYSSGTELTANGTVDLRFGGSQNAYDNFGESLAVGDFNNDGIDDLAAGASGAETGGVSGGAVTVFWGTDAGLFRTTSDTYSQGTPNWDGAVESGDDFGAALAAGDFDDDGYDDLAIGVPYEDVGSTTSAGAANVAYGTSNGLGSASILDQNDVTSTSPEEYDYFGYSLAAGNFDGLIILGSSGDDLVVGAPYEDWGSTTDAGVIHHFPGASGGLSSTGSSTVLQTNLSAANEDYDRFGWTFAVGNFDGNNYPDLAIGVPYEDDESGSTDLNNSGYIHVLYGDGSSGLNTSGSDLWKQSDLTGTLSEDGDYFGYALSATPPKYYVESDLAIGSPYEDWTSTTNAGVVHVMYGTNNGLSATGAQMWRQASGGVSGATEEYDYFGRSLAMSDDFDDSGDPGLIVGVPYEDTGSRTNDGAAHVLYGSSGSVSSTGSQLFYGGTDLGTVNMLRAGGTGEFVVQDTEFDALAASPQAAPERFAIVGNSPNPFGERTEISFTLPEASTVSLVVYDVLGRVVARPVQKVRRPAGTHRIPVDASRWASGTYLYRLTTEQGSETGRMTLVR